METTETQEEENKYQLYSSTAFKKDYKRYLNNNERLAKIDNTIRLLKIGGVKQLPLYMKAHFLTGNYKGHLECHIEPDLLIIWLQYDDEQKRIVLTRLGSHAELFKK